MPIAEEPSEPTPDPSEEKVVPPTVSSVITASSAVPDPPRALNELAEVTMQEAKKLIGNSEMPSVDDVLRYINGASTTISMTGSTDTATVQMGGASNKAMKRQRQKQKKKVHYT